ncbi:MAG: WD40 repeat domain-containing protein [Planctomycetes bacterium]|nr:WD40 repeat domain-containing protein [Planctomycetota bacterium]
MARRRLLLLLVVSAGLYLALVPGSETVATRAVSKADANKSSTLIARLGDPRLRQLGAGAPVFSPDSTAVAALGDGRADVIEWDVASARERRRYLDPRGPGQYVSVTGYTPDGDRLLVTYDLARVVVFDTATGAVACQVECTGALAPDLRSLAGRGWDGRLAVWSLETGRPLAVLGTDPIYDVAFSWDGHWVAAGHYSETVPEGGPVTSPAYKGVAWVWPAAGGPRRTLVLPGEQHSNGVSVVWVRPNRVLVWTRPHMAVFDAATGERVASAVPSRAGGGFWQVWQQDGRLYVRESNASEGVEFDPDALTPLGGRPPGAADPFGPVLSPDGAVRAERVGRYLRLVDGRTNRPLHPYLDRFPTRAVNALRFSTDGRRMLTTGGDSVVWDLPSGAIRCRLGDHTMVTNAHLTPDGHLAVGTDYTKTGNGSPLVVWNADTGAEVYRETVGDPRWGRRGLGLDPGGGFWVHGDGAFLRYEVPSGRVLRSVREFERNAFVLLSPDGSRLASGGPAGLAVLRTDSGQWQNLDVYSATYRGGCERADPPCASPVAFSPDGRRLLTGCGYAYESGWQLRSWSLTASRVAGEWSHVGSYPIFTPDGRFVVAGVVGPERADTELALTPATKLSISSPPLPKLLRVSDPESGVELFRFDPGAEVSTFAVTPDGKYLVVAHVDTTLTVWDWQALLRANLRR